MLPRWASFDLADRYRPRGMTQSSDRVRVLFRLRNRTGRRKSFFNLSGNVSRNIGPRPRRFGRESGDGRVTLVASHALVGSKIFSKKRNVVPGAETKVRIRGFSLNKQRARTAGFHRAVRAGSFLIAGIRRFLPYSFHPPGVGRRGRAEGRQTYSGGLEGREAAYDARMWVRRLGRLAEAEGRKRGWRSPSPTG